MTYKYQLILLGDKGKNVNNITTKFFESVSELKIPQNSFVKITASNFSQAYKENQPAFCIYLGNQSGRFVDLGLIEKLVKDAVPILPVFFSSFETEIPKELENYNGQKFEASAENKIVNLALESFGKLRQTRRVFVSYKRDESSSVAIQLYEALERNNFDVFLDTHSINKGDLFQEELWHRMTDCDVIVMINTPKFMTSRWCKEELAEASAKQIGILQLIWPGHSLENIANICKPLQLTKLNFLNEDISSINSPKLKESYIDTIVQEVESLRARNLAARQDNLITEFTNLANKHGKHIHLQPERFLTEDLGDNKRRIFIPTIGIPQSIDCNQTDELKQEISDYDIDSIHLIYDDIRIREKWLQHLNWLNNYLNVKTLKKQNFDQWLQSN
ncbi:MAG: toll/interleukin-1 receptor domain-containing protein [Glaciecola sp.]